MRYPYLFAFSLLCLSACSGNSNNTLDQEEVTIANETGQPAPLPPDVIYQAKPLIGGKLYSQPNFEAGPLAYFDTAQQIHILDTTNTLFVKARILQDTVTYTGYVPKTILPEQPHRQQSGF